MIHKLIYKLAQWYMKPSLSSEYIFLLSSDKWSRERLEKYQLEKLRELLCFAYNYSPYYTKLYNKLCFDPKAISSLSDLGRLPIMDKSVAIKHNESIQSTAKFKNLIISESSGTSGATLKMYRSEEWDSKNRAALFRGYNWYGVNPWDRNGYFWGFNIAKNKRWITKALWLFLNRIFTFR